MIPYSLFACELPLTDGSILPIRVLDLSSDGFTFRVPQDLVPDPEQKLQAHFYSFAKDAFRTVSSSLNGICPEENTEFFTLYRFTTDDPDFLEALNAFLTEYIALIRLKAEHEPAEVTEKLTGYPAAQESIFSASYSAWLKKQLDFSPQKTDLSDCGKVLALCADRPSLYRTFLSMSPEAFKENRFSALCLKDHPLASLPFHVLYIGNSYCTHLLPSPELLSALWKKARSGHLTPVLQLPPMKEADEPYFRSLLRCLLETDPGAEILFNDLGFLSLLPKEHSFRLTAGLFLNRSRKDPRFRYRNGYDRQRMLYEGAVSDTLLAHLTDAGTCRIETEDARMPLPLPGALHLPYIRLNTGGFCPMYAAVRNHNPLLQEAVQACPHDCETHHFLYPDFLKTVGAFNSVFRLDSAFLKDPAKLKELSRIDRIVLEVH